MKLSAVIGLSLKLPSIETMNIHRIIIRKFYQTIDCNRMILIKHSSIETFNSNRTNYQKLCETFAYANFDVQLKISKTIIASIR